MFTTLTVCQANECRSVFAADLIRSQTSITDWDVVSAGIGAFPGSPQCEYSLSDHSQVHSSRQLEIAAVKEASMILTMERIHRSRVAQIFPAARSKSFTLIEASYLAKFVSESILNKDSEFVDIRTATFQELNEVQKLKWFVSEMNVARGFVIPIMDEILDAHGENAIPHQLAFTQIENHAQQVVDVLLKVQQGLI